MGNSDLSLAAAAKLDKFTGTNFKRWQKKMVVYLNTLKLDHVLKEKEDNSEEAEPAKTAFNEAWDMAIFKCKNYILNCLQDNLYDEYYTVPTARELWLLLEKKYKTEDAGSKKFVVSRFLDYKMVDEEPVVSQFEELHIIFHEIEAENMKVSEGFQIASVIDMLPLPGKTSVIISSTNRRI